jgi:hypothetical protein
MTDINGTSYSIAQFQSKNIYRSPDLNFSFGRKRKLEDWAAKEKKGGEREAKVQH